MTVQNLIDRLEELTQEFPELMTSEVVFHLPPDAVDGELAVAEYDEDRQKWINEGFIGFPEFVKGSF